MYTSLDFPIWETKSAFSRARDFMKGERGDSHPVQRHELTHADNPLEFLKKKYAVLFGGGQLILRKASPRRLRSTYHKEWICDSTEGKEMMRTYATQCSLRDQDYSDEEHSDLYYFLLIVFCKRLRFRHGDGMLNDRDNIILNPVRVENPGVYRAFSRDGYAYSEFEPLHLEEPDPEQQVADGGADAPQQPVGGGAGLTWIVDDLYDILTNPTNMGVHKLKKGTLIQVTEDPREFSYRDHPLYMGYGQVFYGEPAITEGGNGCGDEDEPCYLRGWVKLGDGGALGPQGDCCKLLTPPAVSGQG